LDRVAEQALDGRHAVLVEPSATAKPRRSKGSKKLEADEGSNLGSDAYLMTTSQIRWRRAIVLREGQFSRAHTFAV
jgi:hypothetical protein